MIDRPRTPGRTRDRRLITATRWRTWRCRTILHRDIEKKREIKIPQTEHKFFDKTETGFLKNCDEMLVFPIHARLILITK